MSQTPHRESSLFEDRLPPPTRLPHGLAVNKFDRVSSMLLACMMFLAIMVGMLLLLWIASGPSTPNRASVLELKKVNRGQNTSRIEMDFVLPGEEEAADLLEPSLEDTLQSVTHAVSRVPATLQSVDSDSDTSSRGSRSGRSDHSVGPDSGGPDIVPRFERWKLKFVAKNVADYAAQLDHYGIELAAIGGSIQGVDYASNLASNPTTRRGPSEGEDRLYFMWTTPGPLMQYDRQLLEKATVPLSGRQMLKLVPQELENRLASIELHSAQEHGHKSVTEIAQTIFESRPTDAGYEFVVIDQSYRTVRRTR